MPKMNINGVWREENTSNISSDLIREFFNSYLGHSQIIQFRYATGNVSYLMIKFYDTQSILQKTYGGSTACTSFTIPNDEMWVMWSSTVTDQSSYFDSSIFPSSTIGILNPGQVLKINGNDLILDSQVFSTYSNSQAVYYEFSRFKV